MNHVLTDKAVKSAKPGVDGQAVRLWDGGGLYLQVGKTGSRLWRYKYRLGGKENVFALGAYPEVSLAQARDRHKEARELVEKGVAPRSQREIEKVKAIAVAADTFKATAEEWIAKKKATWTPTYLRQVEAFLKSDVYPAFGALPISQVTAAHILAVMKSAESRGAETIAILIRQWCSQIFRYAVSNLRAESDPAAALRGAVIRPKVKTQQVHSRSRSWLACWPSFKCFSGRAADGYRDGNCLMLTFVRTV
jgi:hypothetical protein